MALRFIKLVVGSREIGYVITWSYPETDGNKYLIPTYEIIHDLEVGRRLIELGFNTDTARILFFIPLIEVAWADGKIGYEESYRIVDVVRHRGIRATSAAYDFLSQLTIHQSRC